MAQIDTSIYGIQRPTTVDPMATMSGLLQVQGQQQQLQAGRMELASKQRALDDDNAVRGALSKWSTGNGKVDWDSAISELEASGNGPSAFKLREQVIKQRKEQADSLKTSLENTESTLTLAGRIVRGMESEIQERGASSADEVFGRTKSYLSNLLTPELADQLGARYDPARVKAVLQWERTASESITAQKDLFDQLDKIRDDEARGLKDAPETADKWIKLGAKAFSNAQSPEDWAKVDANLQDQGFPTAIRQMFDPTFSPEAVGRAAALGMDPKERADVKNDQEARSIARGNLGVAQGNLQVARDRLQMEKDDITKVTPEGLDVIAHQFATTGQMPALGQGAKDLRAKVINRAAELYNGLNLPEQQAAYLASKASLGKLTGQSDALEAFEKTALKNLDVFLETAKKVADTGSPYLNTPIRKMNENLLGDPKMAAFNTARRVVIPEFARIIANPGLSGVLSDSAREEVDELLKGNATLKQIIAAANTLKTDAKNRRDSMHEQITAVTERLKRPPGLTLNGQGGGGLVELTDTSGATYRVPANQVDAALADPEYKKKGLRRK